MIGNFFDFGFNESKFKPNLKMAVERIKIATNRKTNAVKVAQREIAKLLEQEKDEKAAIRCEAVIRDDATIEAYGIIELICDLLFERSRLIAAEKECPEDLKAPVHTIIWCCNRADIPELQEVRKQFVKKYGKEFVERAESNADNAVNERVVHKLSIRPPSAAVVVEYLQEIAKKHEVTWTPTDKFREEGEKVFSAMAAPTGFSVPMAPGTNFSHIYRVSDEAPPPPSMQAKQNSVIPMAMPIEGPMPVTVTPAMPPTASPVPPPPYSVNKEGLLDFRSPGTPPLVAVSPVIPDAMGGGGGAVLPPVPPTASFPEIPHAPTTLPQLPPDLPLAPSTSYDPRGPGGPPPDVDDLEARFKHLRGGGSG